MQPLPRSLAPLPGESIVGYLLRLAYRLAVSPSDLARMAGWLEERRGGLEGAPAGGRPTCGSGAILVEKGPTIVKSHKP